MPNRNPWFWSLPKCPKGTPGSGRCLNAQKEPLVLVSAQRPTGSDLRPKGDWFYSLRPKEDWFWSVPKGRLVLVKGRLVLVSAQRGPLVLVSSQRETGSGQCPNGDWFWSLPKGRLVLTSTQREPLVLVSAPRQTDSGLYPGDTGSGFCPAPCQGKHA